VILKARFAPYELPVGGADRAPNGPFLAASRRGSGRRLKSPAEEAVVAAFLPDEML
jgi:hypothetical protein